MFLRRIPFRGLAQRYSLLLTVLAINTLLATIILLLNLRGVDFSWLTGLYSITALIGWYALPPLIVVSLLFLPLFAFERTLKIIVGSLVSLFIFYLFIDSLTYGVFKFHIDLFWLQYIFEDFQGFGIQTTTLVTVALVFCGIAALQFGIFKLAKRVRRRGIIGAGFVALVLVSMVHSQIVHIVAYEKNDSRITSLTPHFPFYYPVTSHKNAVKYGDFFPLGTEAAAATIASNPAYSSLTYPLAEIEHGLPAGQRPPNIVLLMLESWRAETMDETVTPNIHAFSKRAQNFRNHFSSGNSTTSGVFGLFYGLYATYWTAVKANSAYIDNPLLIDVLKENDFEFGIYADSNFDRHKIKDTVFRGIDVHEEFEGKEDDDRDGDLNRRMIEFIGEQAAADKPFMAYAFYKASHFSYYYPESFAKFQPARKMNMMFASNKKDPELYLNDQRNAVHYLDSLVGDVIASLDSLNIMDETIVIITTDHAEEFNDNGANYWGHGSNFTKYQTQVPLIIHFPGKAARSVNGRTCHIDIVPTLLREYFGCRNEIESYSNGRSLFAAQKGDRPLVIGSYVNHAFLLGDDVYAIFPMYTKKYKLGDIGTKAGTPRTRDLRLLMTEMNRFLSAAQPSGGESVRPAGVGGR